MPLASAAVTALAAASAAAALTVYATLSPGSQLCGPTLVAPPLPAQFALTFDDGPNPAVTPYLLDLLARNNVRATFFLIGQHVRAQPVLTRAIAQAGHAVGNHTMHHPRLTRLAEARILDELSGCNHLLEDTLGRPTALFRPPHGARRPAVLRIARSLGLATVQWNLIVGDWKPLTGEEIFRRIDRGVRHNRARGHGTNLVLHDGGQHTLTAERLPTVEAVRRLLPTLPPETTFVTPPDWR